MPFFFKHKEHKVSRKAQNAFLKSLCSFLLVSLSPLLLVSLSPLLLFSQVSQGGLPASFQYSPQREITEISIPAPDLESVRLNDINDEKLGLPRQVGIAVKAGINVTRDVEPEVLADGTKAWQVIISCKDALAIGLYFDDFHMPAGCSMFVYDEAHRFILGAYTESNNRQNSLFSIELVPGDRLVVEIDAAANVKEIPACNISEISYVYRDLPDFLGSTGSSDACEININCAEGDDWQFQKHGVARIYVKQSGGYFWCTGSLVNNTLQNNDPFFLTANHCGATASAQDISQWVFYFNFEAPGCENPVENPPSSSMTGAIKLAGASTSGSDFLLLRLADTVPVNYEPYYNGWSIENTASPHGVTIHHPAGDIKKISTYTVPVESSQWFSTPNTHWLVYWSQTANGWGVTEGGSSGAPLYDNTGKIIGTLTGGQASCEPDGGGPGTGPDQPDYFGKFSYSWDQNGSEPDQQLKYWLDPINSGVTELTGKHASLTAAFESSETLILIGSSVNFTNLSSGLPLTYEWTFEGGVPGTYSGHDSILVKYPDAGYFDVKLVVSNLSESDTLLLKDYIHVVGKVYPNPTSGLVNIYLDDELPATVDIQVYNIFGQNVYEKKLSDPASKLMSLDLSYLSPGVYLVRIAYRQRYLFAKVMITRENK